MALASLALAFPGSPCFVSGVHFGLGHTHDLPSEFREALLGRFTTLVRRWINLHRTFFLPLCNCGFDFSERWTFRKVMAGQRLVGQATADDGLRGPDESLRVIQLASQIATIHLSSAMGESSRGGEVDG